LFIRHFSLLGSLVLATAILTPSDIRADNNDRAIRLLIRDASRALQAGNAPLFLSAFDRKKMPRFDQFEANIRALLAQKSVSTSVELGPLTVEGDQVSVSVDWLLQLSPRHEFGQIETRHEIVAIRLARMRGKWKLIALAPPELFYPTALETSR